MGSLRMTLPGGAEVFVYPKDDHQPASYTVLNFVAEDVEAAVDQLNPRGPHAHVAQQAHHSFACVPSRLA